KASPNANGYSYAVVSGALPDGVTLNSSSGLISGTPTTLGNFSFTIKATDTNGCSGSQPYALSINCATISLLPSTLPNGVVGASYSQGITPSGGTAPYTY